MPLLGNRGFQLFAGGLNHDQGAWFARLGVDGARVQRADSQPADQLIPKDGVNIVADLEL